MKEHEDRYAAVIEMHKPVGANIFSWIKHKHIYVVLY